MPRKTTDGKQPSGQDNRNHKKARDESARKDEAKRRKLSGQAPLRMDIAPPPIGDPTAGVAWAHDVACALLWEVMQDPVIDTEKRWRYGSDLVAKVSMTHARALVQKRLADLGLDDEIEDSDNVLQTEPIARRDLTRRRRAAENGAEVRRSLSDPEGSDGEEPP